MNQSALTGRDVVGIRGVPFRLPSVDAGTTATRAGAFGAPVRVLRSELVALRAVCSTSVRGRGAVAGKNVLARSLGVKVLGVHAAAVRAIVSRKAVLGVAHVIYVEPVWDRPNELLVRPTVSADRLAIHRHDRVPLSVYVREPAPTAVRKNHVVDVEPVKRSQVSHVESVARMQEDAK